jgi:hypothetical protein
MKEIIKIGIDPGTKTGVCVFSKKRGIISIYTTNIIDALNKVYDHFHVAILSDIVLYVENPNTWGRGYSSRKLHREQGAGSVKRDFAIWKEFAEYYDIQFVSVPVQRVKDGSDVRLFEKITGYKGRTSKHAREACYMVFE